ncbi:MAG TPA: FxLYD domain-containing protein [Vicinamibacterales bacterium]|jgi:hypothetical protein
MDATLVTVTVLSMGMAGTLSVIVWRLLRDEQRRSEARIAALTAAASAPAVDAAPPPIGDGPVRKPAPVIGAFRAASSHAPSDLPLRLAGATPAAEPVTAAAMFAPPADAPAWGNRLAIIAALVLVGASALLIAMTAGRARAAAHASNGAAAPQAPLEAELELLSLRDTRDSGALTISGMVHNPRTAPALARVTVTAYTFDDKGAFLASGRALLDVTALAPGEDSPFVVSVPAGDAVARYRIGFRAENGRVIGHVDRRQQGPVASAQRLPEETHE